MLYNYKFENGARARVWLEDIPQIIYDDQKVFCKEVDSKDYLSDRSIAIELSLLRHTSNYAMLGMRYSYKKEDNARIIVHTSDYNGKIYEDNIALCGDIVRIGIPKEYVENILKYVEDNTIILPLGTLEVNVGAHAEIGSSIMIFGRVFKVAMEILKIQDLNSECISEVIGQEFSPVNHMTLEEEN